ncbi:uncharacterized protein LOC121383096 [Gigantopelta aegis]|uniref:uncharacterized protein LOC121383096 n=1 Tax=Gigantopelta aegis TaxID=1735272 RepID=UPI001B888086|nr:uncharacterized protein LOC121383096 [Gigantopelta aegis]
MSAMLILKYFSFLLFTVGVTEALYECTYSDGRTLTCDECCEHDCCAWTSAHTYGIGIGAGFFFSVGIAIGICRCIRRRRTLAALSTTTTPRLAVVTVTRQAMPGRGGATPGPVNPPTYSPPAQENTKNAQIPKDAVYSYNQ